MTSYNVDDIVNEVRIAIDQNINYVGEGVSTFNDVDSDTYVDVDTLSLNESIKSKIVDAARMIEKAAPTHMLGDVPRYKTDGIVKFYKVDVDDKYYYAKVMLPEDYLRLVTFRMSDWASTLTSSELITAEEPAYTLQRSKIERVRGNRERPVIALVKALDLKNGAITNNGLCIEAYSTDNNTQCICTYIPMPQINGEEIMLPEKLYRSIVYATAYLVSLLFGDVTKAQSLLMTARSLADIDYNTQQVVQQPQQDEEQ